MPVNMPADLCNFRIIFFSLTADEVFGISHGFEFKAKVGNLDIRGSGLETGAKSYFEELRRQFDLRLKDLRLTIKL